MIKTKHARQLLLQLMIQADNDFMSLDFDRMTEDEIKEPYEKWNRLILFYENLYQPLTPKRK